MSSHEIPIPIGRIAVFATFDTPAELDLVIARGDSFQKVFRLFREVDSCTGEGSGAQTLTGLQGRFVLRSAPDHPFAYTFTVDVDTAAGSGRVTVSADAAATRALPILGVWDLEINDGTDDLRKTVARGHFQLRRDTAT